MYDEEGNGQGWLYDEEEALLTIERGIEGYIAFEGAISEAEEARDNEL